METRTAVVMGPHSSGTRLMARVARAGLETHGWQIYHRSLPGSWPTKGDRYIWIERDHHATMCSQIANGHAVDPTEAHRNLVDAKDQLHLGLSQGLQLLTVHYTELVTATDRVIWNLANWFGVPIWSFGEEIFNGDSQYTDLNLADVRQKDGVKAQQRAEIGTDYRGVGIGIPQATPKVTNDDG